VTPRKNDEEEDEDMLETTRSADRKTAEGDVRTLSARTLLGSGRTLRIEHEGEVYTLRLTRNNKLILTK
jgi:hemin uptake protein HemP